MKISKFYIVVLLITVPFCVFSQANNGFTSHDLFRIKEVTSAVLSPDGKYVGYTIKIPRPFNETPGKNFIELSILNLNTGISKTLVSSDKTLHSVYWTPDSKKITYIADKDGEKITQVYTLDVFSDSIEQITNSNSSIESYSWNPDGSSIAYIATDEDTGRNKLIEKGFNAEVYEEDIPHKTLYIYHIDTKSTTKLSNGITVYNASWNPDGKLLAALVSEKNLVDYSYIFSKIQIINPETREVNILVNTPGKLGEMKWSPDGKHIAFISGVDIYDPVAGSVYVADVPNNKDFTQLINYSKDLYGSVTDLAWKDSNTLIYSADESVNTTLTMRSIDSDDKTVLIEGGLVFRNFDYANGVISLIGNTSISPDELYTLNIENKKITKQTSLNPWIDGKKLAKQEKLSYISRDGLTIEGVLIYPLGYRKGQLYPLIVYIHGGPEACEKNGWVTSYGQWGQIAASRGYFVLMPNYRGSSGRGVAFSKMDQGDMGGKDFNDVLDGMDYLVSNGMVDKTRIGIGGGSYGGYFAAWGATKHTERFAAAVVFVGISDNVSKRYTTDIPFESYFSHWTFWTHENYELVFDRSPVKYAPSGKTPTLILHGKEDTRVHPSQALELHRSLKLHGKAPVRLIWYPGEGHGNQKNPARLDYSLRTMEWFDYYLKSTKPKNEMPARYLDYGVDIN